MTDNALPLVRLDAKKNKFEGELVGGELSLNVLESLLPHCPLASASFSG